MMPPEPDGDRAAESSVSREHAAMRVEVLGRVQGVGFRPFVVRLAVGMSLTGWVKNTPDGVKIHVEGRSEHLANFRQRLELEAPPASDILQVTLHPTEPTGSVGFSILESESDRRSERPGRSGVSRVVITPDLATCPRCQGEFQDAADRRYGYALSGCTDCGPRFSIQTSSPFDRIRTTMSDFSLCEHCQSEYGNVNDRRFHAQNIACPRCGPRLVLERKGGSPRLRGPDERESNDFAVLEETASLLRAGAIVAVKGIGGFHLLCDATSSTAVERLRERKHRDRKPFAVMFHDLADLERDAVLDEAARTILTAPAAPIVLLQRRMGCRLADEVAPGLQSVGAMVAYTLLHRELIRAVGRPLVATSANPSDEPMPVENDVARAELNSIADAFLLHDRRILRHADDSVVRLVGGKPVPIRIGRGLAPVRIEMPCELPRLLATGGHLKAAIALTRGREVFLGQHIGDLETPSARRRYTENVADLTRLFGVQPDQIVHDAHPDYFTTRFAETSGLPCLAIQHHHAHVLACLAEHGECGPALGIAWDGTGYGDDGTIWGGEFLAVEGGTYRRVGSLWPFRLVGGDRAAREPRRSAAGVSFELGDDAVPEDLPFSDAERRLLLSALQSSRTAVFTTSAGRLFDAWASLLGVVHLSAYEAEAAMRLEELADPAEQGAFDVPLVEHPGPDLSPLTRLDWRPWITETRRLLARGCPRAKLSAYFHNSLAEGSLKLARQVGLGTVVLSGGCFQNRLLAENVRKILERGGFRVLTHQRVPPGDGGLALGQIWAAALRLST